MAKMKPGYEKSDGAEGASVKMPPMKKEKGGGKVRHVGIEIVGNGYVVRIERGGGDMMGGKSETHVAKDTDELDDILAPLFRIEG